MLYLLKIVVGFAPFAHANTPKLDKFGEGAAGHEAMWNKIRETVHVDITATDIVAALTGGIVQFIFTFIAHSSETKNYVFTEKDMAVVFDCFGYRHTPVCMADFWQQHHV